jgi:hypothetical protein
MNNFVSSDFENYINNLIRKNILTNLNETEYNIIFNLLINLINNIAIRFNFDLNNPDIYVYQLKQNNNRDIYAIFNLLFPYIDDVEGTFYLHKDIYFLKDITIKKTNDKLFNGFDQVSSNPELDNITKNPYKITNLQFNRNIPNKENLYDYNQKRFTEYEYNLTDIFSNYYLLLNSIDQISNKLYVNWINIRPITDYKQSYLYKKSFKYFVDEDQFYAMVGNDKVEFDWYNNLGYNSYPNNEDKPLKYYQGLSCGDYYNMIHHELYFGVKDYKWLIYELPYDRYKDMYTYWDLLKNYFKNIDKYIIAGNDYEYIEDTKPAVISDWTEKKNMLKNSIKENNENRVLLYNLLYFFERKYSQRDSIAEYIKLLKRKDDNDDILENIEEFDDTEINDEKIKESWESLEMRYIYDYIKETINKFKKTWYGHQMITLSKTHPFDQKNDINIPNRHKVSFKNIYNFSQSIIFYTFYAENKSFYNSKKILRHYKKYTWYHLGTLNSDEINSEKIKLILRYKYYNDLCAHKCLFVDAMVKPKENILTIFRIDNVLRRLYPNINKSNLDLLTKNIYLTIKSNLTDIIFECLFLRGLLNEFIPDRECTDQLILSNDYETGIRRRKEGLRKNVFNDKMIEKYKKCYYYLTDDTYGNLPIVIKKGQNNMNYFEYLVEAEPWFSFYAMDWIAQIGFFHRYINNRVIYVTGATGAGKSSQIPKLLLYGLKMIEFNRQGKVVSTQPRISPTVSNAREISEQMGVGIVGYSTDLDKEVKTFMSYIQYKTAEKEHLGEKSEYYFKEMTDGSLVNELFKNPFLKKLKIKDKNDIFNETLDFGLNNAYDIVIVDESHEHNKNMDIILTLMKYAIYWNNSLKLVIISATMVDDEPIYRRYYRDINDNMMYPLNLYNICSEYVTDVKITVNAEQEMNEIDKINYKLNQDYKIFGLDRLSVDRRFHISPPGETTQHKVIDIYSNVDTKDYLEAEELGVKKVYELMDSKTSGDILFFSLGKEQIRKLVTELNEKTPPYVIALPFYSELNQYWKDLGEKTEKIDFFTTHKLDVLKEIDNPGTGNKVPPKTYTQVIVVATNVAEASITIKRLRHVIETGYYYSITYDNINRQTDAKVAPITESSRIQRRGRVGRVAGGTVYYMYAKGTRENIFPTYNICVSNITNDIFKMQRKKNDEELLVNVLFDSCLILDCINKKPNYPNDKMTFESSPANLYKCIIDVQETFNKIKKPDGYNEDTWDSVLEMLNEQFVFHLLNGRKYNVIYFGNEEKYTIDNSMLYKPHLRYITGYDMATLIDFYGTFHLIHPAEDLSRRHILTGLIDNRLNEKIYKFNRRSIEKTFSIYSNLFYSRMIIPDKVQLGFDIGLKSFNTNTLLSYENNKTRTYQYNLKAIYEKFHSESKYVYQYLCENNSYKSLSNDQFNKTIFSTKLFSIYDSLELIDTEKMDENIKIGCIIALLYGLILGIEKEICKVIAMIFVFGYELKSFIPQQNINGKPKFIFNKNPLNRFKSSEGDLITLYNIFNGLINDLPYLSLWENIVDNNLKTENQYVEIKNKYIEIKKMLTSDEINDNKSINKWNLLKNIDIDINTFEILQKYDQKGIMNEDKGINEYKKFVSSKNKKIDDESISLITWCMNNNINYNKMYKAVKMYKSIIGKISIDSKNFDWFKNNLVITKELSIEENILKCFLFGFIRNNLFYMENMKYKEIITNEELIVSKIFPQSEIYDTTILPKPYAFYIAKGKNGIINLNNVELRWIMECIPDIVNIYNITQNYRFDDINVNDIYVDMLNIFSLKMFVQKENENTYEYYGKFLNKLINEKLK